MQHKKLVACVSTALLALTFACSKNSPSPVSPGGTDPGLTEQGPEGQTLKTTPPVPQSPVNGAQPDGILNLVATKAQTKFGDVPLSYQFQIRSGQDVVYDSGVIGGGGAGPTGVQHNPTVALTPDAMYTWRVRASFQNAFGPWSSDASFKAPVGGYIRGNEVFDPLTNERTVGEIVGNVTFIPGVGVRLNDFTSHIRYRLEQTLLQGEFSIIVTGMATNNEGGKTKVMAMSEGLADIVTNDRRMTVEKRGDPMGVIAWRFISYLDQIDTVRNERVRREFDPNKSYLFTTTWDGFFRVRIQEGGASGPEIYNFGKHYEGPYDPNPHYAFIGAPVGRSGTDGATVPGMIVRNVWISSRPRPAAIGQ
jgi:hypothetical protein